MSFCGSSQTINPFSPHYYNKNYKTVHIFLWEIILGYVCMNNYKAAFSPKLTINSLHIVCNLHAIGDCLNFYNISYICCKKKQLIYISNKYIFS